MCLLMLHDLPASTANGLWIISSWPGPLLFHPVPSLSLSLSLSLLPSLCVSHGGTLEAFWRSISSVILRCMTEWRVNILQGAVAAWLWGTLILAHFVLSFNYSDSNVYVCPCFFCVCFSDGMCGQEGESNQCHRGLIYIVYFTRLHTWIYLWLC